MDPAIQSVMVSVNDFWSKASNHLSVAEILGHANGQMVATTYQHLNKAEEHLRRALMKGTEDA